MRAHDVRHLAICVDCDNLGDKRRMIETGQGLEHDGCAFKRLGAAILALPREERLKFTIGGVGNSMMRRLVDSVTTPTQE